jgi:hypothetical protein
MKLGEIHILPLDVCQYCQHELNTSVGTEDDPPIPSPGDYTLCLYCGGINRLNDELQMVLPSQEELDEAETHSTFSMRRKAAEVFIRGREKTP